MPEKHISQQVTHNPKHFSETPTEEVLGKAHDGVILSESILKRVYNARKTYISSR